MDKRYTITFMGKGNNSSYLNLTRQVKSEGFEIITSEFKISDETIAGYLLIPGKQNDTAHLIEERLKKIIKDYPELKFIIQNALLFDYIYSI